MKKRILSLLLVFSMVLSMLPLQAFAVDTDSQHTFVDVKQGDWFYDNVLYVFEHGLFSGVSDTEFDPQGTMTRAMYVTVMGRVAEMQPTDYTQSGFADVPNDHWASPSVAWAKEKAITSGVGDGQFAPNDFVTREQMAVFTVRFFESYGIPFPKAVTNTTPKDMDRVSDYAKEAVLKLWECGLFQGDESGNFNPQSNTTRAEAATFFGRTDKIVEAWYVESGVKEEATRPSGGSGTTYYTYKFVSNGGATVSDRTIAAGKRLDSLPVPYQENAIFVAWCYDEALTDFVETTDVATESAILYAKYEPTGPLLEDELVPVAVAIDRNPDFSITITATENITVEQLQERIVAKNLSSQLDKEWFKITKSGNQFTITGLHYPLGQAGAVAGFVEGSAYKITLLDDGLSFAGQDSSTRVYDFTIARSEVMNVSLDKTIKEIPMGDVTNLTVNGQPADTVYVPNIVAGQENNKATNGSAVGSFTYSKKNLAIGDTVAIYKGNTPPSQEQGQVVTSGDTGFVIITGKTGTTYTYKTAEAEDILFTPDVLPVSVDADTDGNATNNSMTVPKSSMDYTDDRYAETGLNASTTIDVGDFIAFYTGEFQDGTLASYAKISAVTPQDDSYVITYKSSTLPEIQASMAASKTENLEGDVLLDGKNVEDLEHKIEEQAKESGFAEDASMLLASLALETDSFTELSDEYGLKTVDMQMNGEKITPETLQLMAGGAGGGAGGAAGGSSVSWELSHLDANIATELEHFGNRDGLAVTLELGITITIDAGESDIEIDVVGAFTQEMSLDVSVDGDAVWKTVCGFIPYIAEYQVNASVELYTFTRISVDASITSHGKGPGPGQIEIDDISGQIEGLLDKVDREDAKTDARTLEEKYAAMLETESDWVSLFEQELMKLSFNVLYVVDIRMSASFVVSANMNLALGSSFEYTNAKKYIYSISVFAGNVENDVIDLVPEHYEFDFYVMGTMGLRAGVNIEFAVGILSCDLGSIGFGAEVGAYVKVWGYFHYKLEVTNPLNGPSKKISTCTGALLFELGVYLEITFKVQILCDSLSYNPTLYENEWPLWQVGYQDNVRDFTIEQEEMPEISLKKFIKSTQIPDDIFEMAYLDLKEGIDENGELFTAMYDDGKDFKIISTNPAFSYDPANNKITVAPPDGSVKEEGELRIIWKDRPLAFSSAPIERTIPMQWDNLRDGYAIVLNTNGGTYIPVIVKEYEEQVVQPEDPTRVGYIFDGWYADEGLTKTYTFPAIMPKEDANVYAKWIPATDTEYAAKYWGQVLGKNEYAPLGSEVYKGTTNAMVTPPAPNYVGYETPVGREVSILADGSQQVNYYYDRQVHLVTFETGVAGVKPAKNYLSYGATITAPKFLREGYAFTKWDQQPDTHMGTTDLTYTASWEKTPSEYRVEYYVQQPDGQYELQEIRFESALSTEAIPISTVLDDQYVETDVTTFGNVTVGSTVSQDRFRIGENGRTVVKVHYDRKQYTVTFDLDNGEDPAVQTLYVGSKIVAPTPVKAGFVLEGFGQVAETMGTENLTYTAIWKPATNVTYTVKHCRENLYNAYPTVSEFAEIEVKTDGVTGEDTNAETRTYSGFDAPEEVTQETVLADGSTVVVIQYPRKTYPVNWVYEGYTNGVIETSVKYGKAIPVQGAPTKPGHTFDGWVDSTTKEVLEEGTVMDTEGRTFAPTWTIKKNVPYYVNHVSTDLDGNAITLETEVLYGTFETPTKAVKKSFPGFTAQVAEVTQDVITEGDSMTEVTIAYTRNTYPATWLNRDGSTFATTNVLFEAEIFPPTNAPTYAGYTFEGWASYENTMPLGGVSIRPTWELGKFEITFATNGGTVTPATKEVTYKQPYGELPVPTKAGFKFNGWQNDARELVTAETLVTAPTNHTLTATWTAADIPYTVKHWQANLDGDGYAQVGKDMTMYGIIGEKTAATASTYAGFTAQAIAQQDIQVDGSTVVNVYYDRNEYPVLWTLLGNNITENYKYGEPLTPPTSAETKAGYVIGDWTPAVPETMPAETGLHYAANWECVTYTITFQFDANHAQEVSYTVETIDEIEKPYAYSEDFGYTGQWEDWSIDLANPQDIVVTMKLIPNKYQVSFELRFPAEDPIRVIEPPESITVTYGEPYGPLPNLEDVEGYSPRKDDTWKMELGRDDISITETTVVTRRFDHSLFMNMYRDYCTVNGYAPGLFGDDYLIWNKFNILYGDYITLPKLTEEGYTHTHWTVRGSNVLWSVDNPNQMQYEVLDQRVTLDAIFEENTYTVTFDSVGGTAVEPKTHLYTDEVTLPEIERDGYTFKGWTLDGKTVESVAETTDITLLAVWEPNEYTITYVVEGGDRTADNDNPTGYTCESDDISLVDASCSYHTFDGWYLDDGYETKVEGIAIPKGSKGNKTFYGKFTEGSYPLILDNNVPDNHKTATQMITYNKWEKLDPTPFEDDNPGYDLVGWTTNADGTGKSYGPTHSGQNTFLFVDGILYAQWEAEEHTINYRDYEYGAKGPGNPTTYTVDDYIILQDPSGIEEPYTFLGWYDVFTCEKVTEIEPGNTKNYYLRATWGHPGEFSVSYVDTTDDGTSKYEITRDIPYPAQMMEDTQTVYYRTVNGTAIGGNVKDQGHFLHVGGESAFVEFTKDDGDGSKKEFTVTGENSGNPYLASADDSYIAAKYTAEDVQRYYNVEVYKVTNTVNPQKTGTIDETNGSCRRELEQDIENTIPPEFYSASPNAYQVFNDYRRYEVDSTTNQSAERWKSSRVPMEDYYVVHQGSERKSYYYHALKEYFSQTASDVELILRFDGCAPNSNLQLQLYFYLDDATKSFDTKTTTFDTREIKEDEHGNVLNSDETFRQYSQYVPFDWTKMIVRYDAIGSGTAVLDNLCIDTKVWDAREPVQVGIAPMAYGEYKQGDKITLAVVYDEIVGSVENITLDAIKNLQLADVTYEGGIGTNVLVFTATVDQPEGYTVTDETLETVTPVLGIVKDSIDQDS